MFRDGRITDVDGHELSVEDIVEPQSVRIDGEPLDPPPGLVLMLHKPVGYTCSTQDAGSLVYDLLPPRFRRRSPTLATVGRLDRDTTGLLLMTDDGPLLHRVVTPRSHLEKVYEATLARDLRGDEGAIFASGKLMLESGTRTARAGVTRSARAAQRQADRHRGALSSSAPHVCRRRQSRRSVASQPRRRIDVGRSGDRQVAPARQCRHCEFVCGQAVTWPKPRKCDEQVHEESPRESLVAVLAGLCRRADVRGDCARRRRTLSLARGRQGFEVHAGQPAVAGPRRTAVREPLAGLAGRVRAQVPGKACKAPMGTALAAACRLMRAD